jgi:hypothetical protein
MHRRTVIKKSLSALAVGVLSYPSAEGAFAGTLRKQLLSDRSLPPGYNWDRSIVDYRSLRKSIARLEENDPGGESLYSMLGEVEFARQKLDRSIIEEQNTNGLTKESIDSISLIRIPSRTTYFIMIGQRKLIFASILAKQKPPESLFRWLETDDWKNPWGFGNMDMDLAYMMAFEWKCLGNETAGEFLNFWFEWHDANFDRRTGMWDPLKTGNDLRIMAGAMHQFAIYFLFGKDMPYPEEAIRTVIALQQKDTGLFDPTTYSHNGMDIDAVFIIANLYQKYGVLEKEVKECLSRVYEANFKCFHPEGGAVHRAGIDKKPDWWSTYCRTAIIRWCSEILDITEFSSHQWDTSIRHPFHSSYGGKNMPDWQSDDWYTTNDWPNFSKKSN